MVVITALGVTVECIKPLTHSAHIAPTSASTHLALGYRIRGGGRSTNGDEGLPTTRMPGIIPYDPVGLMAAYLAGGRTVPAGVVTSGLCTGKHGKDGKLRVTFGYSPMSVRSGAPTSRPGRPGPNFGL